MKQPTQHTIPLVPKLRFPEFDGEWEYKIVDEVAHFLDNKRKPIKSADRAKMQGKYPYYGASGIIDYVNEFIFDDELILLGEDGENILSRNVPLAFKVSGKCWINNHAHVLKPKLDTDISFLTENLEKVNYVIYNTGTAQPKLNKEVCKNIRLLFPSLPEQQKIASFLSTVDDKLQNLKEKKRLLKAYKKGVMQQIFSQELRFKDAHGANYPDWDEKKFSNYIKLYRGSSPRPISKYTTKDSEGVNWIKIGDTKGSTNYIINEVSEKITYEGSLKSRKVNEGELILANSMSFGKTYMLNISGCIYDGWFVLREYEEFFSKDFLLHLLNSFYLQKQYKRLSTGGVVQNISSEIVYSTNLFKPSKEEQTKIANFLSAIDDHIQHVTTKLEATQQFKKGLLQQLFV